MASTLLSEARAKLRTSVKPPNASNAVVDSRLNQVVERLVQSGKWDGTIVKVAFTVYAGQITLPRNIETVLAVNYDHAPALVRPLWHTFLQGGPGQIELGQARMGLIDLGGGFPTFQDVTGSVFLRAESSTTETGTPVITVRGLDGNGWQIRSGAGASHIEGYPVTIGAVVGSQVVTSVLRISKPVTNGVVSIYQHDTTTAVETLICRMEPGEQNASYRRYNCDDGAGASPITAICKRAHVDAVADNDVLVIGNTGVLKNGLLALNYEDTNDKERKDAYWADAMRMLNAATREQLGPNAGQVHFQARGYGADGVYAIY